MNIYNNDGIKENTIKTLRILRCPRKGNMYQLDFKKSEMHAVILKQLFSKYGSWTTGSLLNPFRRSAKSKLFSL